MTSVELLASYWTLAHGAEPHSDHEYSSVRFEERVAAAAKAGFQGVGIWHADLQNTLQRLSLRDMKRILDDYGMRHIELEFLGDWFMQGERRQRSDATRQLLLRASEALEARHIKVGDFVKEPCEMPTLVEAFAALCAEAEHYGARIAFEMMPFANIDTLDGALALVAGAGARNGGVVFDLWHIVKLGIPYQDVAKFPSQYLFGIEINDGFLRTPEGMTLLEETTQHRQLCGEGQFDVRRFVSTLQTAGYAGPWGIEVLSRELRGKPVDEIARRAFQTTLAQFGA
jgi:sugar phosphate isomerase/epimerase